MTNLNVSEEFKQHALGQVEVADGAYYTKLYNAIDTIDKALNEGRITESQAIVLSAVLEVYIKEFDLDAG